MEELNEEELHADIDRILSKAPIIGTSNSRVLRNISESTKSTLPARVDDEAGDGEDQDSPKSHRSGASTPRLRRPSSGRGGRSPDGEMPDEIAANLPAESKARYQQARIKMLMKQVEEGMELRKQLNEQVSDLQRQLKMERDENKKAKKRVQLLEAENKRTSNKKTEAASDPTENYAQEIAGLKKDVETAGRLVKKTEMDAKSKETQLKRALETIERLKAQVAELQQQQQQQSQNSGQGEAAQRVEAAENRIHLLERQKSDLLTAFKKQLKLIDVLKKQKIHLEAAQLLSFTEEEFMKAIDWMG